MSAVSPGLTATYDALSRRRGALSGGTLARLFLHDGSAVVHSYYPIAGTSTTDMLVIPGSGEVLSFSDTEPSSASIWVPLHDLNGSTIAHVDSTGSIANSYTYDPNGTPTVSGASVPDPYEFAGMEMDADGLYYAITRYYSPHLVRSISEIGPTNFGVGGGGGSSGGGGGGSSDGGGLGGLFGGVSSLSDPTGLPGHPSFPHLTGQQAARNAQIGTVGFAIGGIIGAAGGHPLAGAILGDLLVTGILDFIDLFGNDTPAEPRKAEHRQHSVQVTVIGTSVPDESPSADPSKDHTPLPNDGFNLPVPGTNYCGPGNYAPLPPHPGIDTCCEAHDNCYGSMGGLDVLRHPFGIGEGSKQLGCDRALCRCAAGSLLTGPESFLVGIPVMGIFCH